MYSRVVAVVINLRTNENIQIMIKGPVKKQVIMLIETASELTGTLKKKKDLKGKEKTELNLYDLQNKNLSK